MKPELLIITGIFFSFIVLEILFTSFFRKEGQTSGDAWVEIGSTIIVAGLTKPFIVAASFTAMLFVFPQYQDNLATLPFWVGFILFLLLDDLTQYWWHRASHTYNWLYKLHRPHHNAAYMSIRLVYRNNVFYYLLMPGLWLSGILVYLGLGWVYIPYLILKMTVIFGAHSDIAWDRPLYKINWLSPVMWVVERTISTPATHFAHHGKHKEDGVTHYKGNYGNLLFFWDVLFGTAKITRHYPKQYGVEGLWSTTFMEQLFWPLVNKKPAVPKKSKP